MAEYDLSESDSVLEAEERGYQEGRRAAVASRRTRSRQETTRHRRAVELGAQAGAREEARARASEARATAAAERTRAQAAQTERQREAAADRDARARSAARARVAPQAAQTIASASPQVTIGAPLAIETLLISVDSLVHDKRFPVPSRLLAAFGLFGLLGMAKGAAQTPASTLAWGLVVATFFAVRPGAGPTTAPGVEVVAGIGNFMAGKYGKPSAAAFGTPGTSSGNEAGLLNRAATGTTARPSGPGAVNAGPY